MNGEEALFEREAKWQSVLSTDSGAGGPLWDHHTLLRGKWLDLIHCSLLICKSGTYLIE